MRTIRVWREIDAPAHVHWDLLTDVDRWSTWGPSIRTAALRSAEFGPGATGTVVSFLGTRLRFEITDVEAGVRWGWRVAGINATDHVVESSGADRCRVGFGVPWPAAPYLAVCLVGLRRLDRLAVATVAERS